MNIAQLEYFVEVVRCESFAEAARKLHVTPQTVSKSIDALSKELGTALLDKRDRKLKPTQMAILLSKYAEDILETTKLMKLAANETLPSQSDRENTFLIFVASSWLRGKCIEDQQVHAFSDLFGKRAQLTHHAVEACMMALQAKIADAVIAPSQPEIDACNRCKIGETALHFAAHRENALAKKNRFCIEDFFGAKLAVPFDMQNGYAMLNEKFSKRNVHVEFVVLDHSVKAYKDFLEQGGAIPLYRTSNLISALNNVAILSPLHENDFLIPIYYLWRKDDGRPEHLKFIHFLKRRLG